MNRTTSGSERQAKNASASSGATGRSASRGVTTGQPGSTRYPREGAPDRAAEPGADIGAAGLGAESDGTEGGTVRP
ncbi:hypothetical protein GCM10010413_27480 [Promicromonospora sukumoe]